MKKLMSICIIFLGISLPGKAQTTEALSLEQAIDKGLHNRFDRKADAYNIDLADNKIQQQKKAWIPDIHAEGNAQYNTDLKPTVVPGEFVGEEDPSLLALGSKSTTEFGLSLEQPVFKPGINTDVKIAKAQRTLEREKHHGTKINIKEQVAQTYLNVLLKRLQYHIAQKEERRYQQYKTLVKGKYNNGVLIKNTYLKAKLDYENAQVNTQKQRQNYELSVDRLKYKINMPEETKLTLTDSIEHLPLLTNELRFQKEDVHRTEIEQLQLQQKENTLQEKRARQNALPSISIVGHYAQLYQNENFHFNQSKWWAPHSYIGLRLSIPITENFQNKNNIHHQTLKRDQLAMELKQQKSDVRYQIQKARTDLQNTQDNMQSAKANYELSQHIYDNQQAQFELGAFQYNGLLDTERTLQDAEEHYMQAAYKFLKAELQYQKAIGEL